ncbi:uncharacterized protein LOC116259334 isoform X3 [Nymphaea colorata]|nr:uncharacterized protein LOC116259334 isoform X1 [Nymphaea colorata]XP_031491389.1 uncharacterized protein LOC116258400 [Nymphaea colorata]XP_031492945.1 uncharacterized protein LOC116259334 isoform X3 [Nymphaea colorata]XP_049935048.1 uncharacterized protein LOC116259334 isoform X2 [Nymphaea colorata]XP_049935049.1 uncharacterized protein LOC116259334 isoform X3 [Nymphaea colorata]
MRDGRDPFRPPATGGGENKKAVMAGRGVIIRAAFFLFLFLFLFLFFSPRPCFCLSAGPAAGPSSFSAGGGAVDQIGQLRAHHTAIKRQVISGGEPGVSRRSSSTSGRGTSARGRGGGQRPHGTSLVPGLYGAAAGATTSTAARSGQDKSHKSSSVSNHSDLFLAGWAAFSCLLMWK